MALVLSTPEAEHVVRATTVLASPLDHPSVDHWRSAVNREVRGLVGADAAGFILPAERGVDLYSDEHDPAALRQFDEFPLPLLDGGRSAFARLVALGAATLA
jgi:hypothetical protein